VARPRPAYAAVTRPKADSTWRTYGQWLHRNATSSAGASATSFFDTGSPVSAAGRAKSGAGVPSGTMRELTAMPPILTGTPAHAYGAPR
jgi:hypothetical protein